MCFWKTNALEAKIRDSVKDFSGQLSLTNSYVG